MKTTTHSSTSQRQHHSAFSRASHLSLEHAPHAVRTARQHARTTLHAWGLPLPIIEDAVVVISELVTNAHLHTPNGPADIHLLTHDQGLVISVRDTCPATTDLPAAPPGTDEDHGRGLNIVRALAEAFGWSHGLSGKIVWARLSLRSAYRPPCAS
ncbi:ATP-binding protein [Streptomyces sp. NPDC006458]|uniref:ATP-binding protein n=1 Tax=Streptomyces sp. NPDC006458 TaxID=3154302 RepID=UPI0033AF17F0